MKHFWKTIKQFKNIRKVLPGLLALLTGHERYIPDIEWSKNSWTHNIFRAYEKIFWRRYGIRAELSSSYTQDDKGTVIVTYQAHSFESSCALIETWIRNLLKKRFIVPIKIWIPKLSSSVNLLNSSPFYFAVAFDASSLDNSGVMRGYLGGNPTWSHTCTGSNLMLVVTFSVSFYTTVTYNSATVTQVQTIVNGGGLTQYLNLLPAPSTGANNIIITNTGSSPGNYKLCGAVSYTGVNQSVTPDSSANSSSLTATTTVATANCWLIGSGASDNGQFDVAMSASTGTLRGQMKGYVSSSFSYALGISDSNGIVGTGSQSLAWTIASNGTPTSLIVSLGPPALPATGKFFTFF